MLFVDMLFVVAVAISFIPILTGYCAQSRGRSFWLWFALGWLLPLVSFFLLFALIARDELNPGRRLLGEARQILREAAEKEAARIKAER
jgi:phosphotransferase system  glucose/maltose/N-acetylglucosamine-specific IIC component